MLAMVVPFSRVPVSVVPACLLLEANCVEGHACVDPPYESADACEEKSCLGHYFEDDVFHCRSLRPLSGRLNRRQLG